MGLRTRYTDHLAALDGRRFEDLGRFVADDVLHDDRPLGLEGCRAVLEEDVATFPDLSSDLAHLAVDGDLVAARLRFDVTPVEPFRGFAPTGGRVRFSEHVLHRSADGRIAQVWSPAAGAGSPLACPREGRGARNGEGLRGREAPGPGKLEP